MLGLKLGSKLGDTNGDGVAPGRTTRSAGKALPTTCRMASSPGLKV